MSDGVSFPQEILTDIFSRLPVKSLSRFKCVSPSWNSLISDPYFAKTHLNRAKTQNPGYLDQRNIVISSSHNLYSIDFGDANPTATKLDFPMMEQHPAHNGVKVWSSCDGLLLVSYTDNDDSNFFLLNPSTRECNKLPAPPPFVPNPVGSCWHGHGVGYNSSTDDYNVVMLSYCKTRSAQSNISIVDVYSLKTNAWRRVQPTHYVVANSFLCGGVFINGCLHWLCWRNGSYVIGAFNLSDQVLRDVPMPASLRGGFAILCHSVEVVGGCLCLVGRRDSYKSEVWKMEEYGVGESWTKLTIDLPRMPSVCFFLCQLSEDKLLFDISRRDEKKLVVYDPIKETPGDMVVVGIPNEFTFWRTYIESLISPILRGGIGPIGRQR